MPQLTRAVFCGILLCMRPNASQKHLLLKLGVGDIVKSKYNHKHFLILQILEEERDEYYRVICLEEGTHEYLGMWEYILKTDFVVVA